MPGISFRAATAVLLGAGVAILAAGTILHWRSGSQAGPTFAAKTGDLPLVIEDWACSRAASVSNEAGAVITCNTPHGLPARTSAGQPWVFHIAGATGPWAALNGRHEVDIIDATRLRLRIDTRSFGPFASQDVALNRGNHELQPLTFAGYAGLGARGSPTPDGLFEITVPAGYSTTRNDRGCPASPVSSFTVSSGVAQVQLARPLLNRPGEYDLSEGREVHFRDFDDPRLNSTAYVGEKGTDRPHHLLAFNPERTQFRVRVEVPDGVYTARPGATAQMLICQPNAFNFMFLPRNVGGYPFPGGRAGNYTKGGLPPPSVNRLEFWVKWSVANRRRADGSYLGTIGTYAKAPDDPDARAERFHFYHFYNPNIYAHRWMKFILNATPQHVRGATGTAILPNEPMLRGWPYYSGPAWDHRPTAYLPNLTAFYIDGGSPPAEREEQKVWIAPFLLDAAADEPDAYVSNITATWSPARHDGRGPGYEIGFNAPKHSRDLFEVRYSTTASLKTSGFLAAKEGGRLPGLNSAYTNLVWYSPSMPEQTSLWVGIRPHMRVLGVSQAGISPILVTLLAEPLLSDGDRVRLSGIAGNTAANRDSAAVRNVPGAFWQQRSGLQGIDVRGNQATVTFDRPHGVVPGQVIEISGSSDNSLGRGPFRLYTVQRVPAPTAFVVNTEGVQDGLYDRNATPAELLSVRVLPALAIEGTGNGNFGGPACAGLRLCAGDGFMTATSEHGDFTEVFLPRFEDRKPAASLRP